MKTLKSFLVTTLLTAISMQMSAQNDLVAANDSLAQSIKAIMCPTGNLTVSSEKTDVMKSVLKKNNFSMKSEDVKPEGNNVKKFYVQKNTPDCKRIEGNSAPFSPVAQAWTLVYWQPAPIGVNIVHHNSP